MDHYIDCNNYFYNLGLPEVRADIACQDNQWWVTMQNRISPALLGFSIFVLPTMVAHPLFRGGYAVHNDYLAAMYHGCWYLETNVPILIGRPLGAFY